MIALFSFSSWFRKSHHLPHNVSSLNKQSTPVFLGSPGGSDSKESACKVGDLGWGDSQGGGHGNPLQYSCLENPHGQRSLLGYSPGGHKGLDTAEQLSARARAHTHTHTHTQRANTSHQWVIVQIGLLTCVTVMLTYYRRGIRASKLTRFASIQQSVKIFIWGAPLSHLELDHKMKQGNHRKDGTEGHLNSCWESPSKCSDGSQNVKEKKTRTSHWWLGS